MASSDLSNPYVRQYLISGDLDARRCAMEELACSTVMSRDQAGYHLDAMRGLLHDARVTAQELRAALAPPESASQVLVREVAKAFWLDRLVAWLAARLPAARL